MRHVLVVVVVLAALGRPARAEHDPQYLVFVSAGVNLGAALHEGNNGFLLGGELSIPFVRASGGDPEGDMRSRYLWAGLYTDVARDFAIDATRFTIGPEIGYSIVGLDGGFVHQFGDAAVSGYAIRPVVTIGFATAYFRHERFSDGTTNEFGVLLKFPAKIFGKKR